MNTEGTPKKCNNHQLPFFSPRSIHKCQLKPNLSSDPVPLRLAYSKHLLWQSSEYIYVHLAWAGPVVLYPRKALCPLSLWRMDPSGGPLWIPLWRSSVWGGGEGEGVGANMCSPITWWQRREGAKHIPVAEQNYLCRCPSTMQWHLPSPREEESSSIWSPYVPHPHTEGTVAGSIKTAN